jgi:ubiquinone/menaquinone biosynthesis C-methylase UbiE
VDVVISNCVINLSPDKSVVFGEIYRTLKPGGRIVISDILRSREIPAELRDNPAAYTG